MERISEHISYQEATRSLTAIKKGIDNTPNNNQLENMRALANYVFEPVRNFFNTPIYICSYFRSPMLNTIIGGSVSSQHCAKKGAAMDMDAAVYGGFTNSELFEFIRGNIGFDQLIWEFGDDYEPNWVHVSFHMGHNRNEVLQAFITKTATQYIRL